jgi:hypothetical protein
LILLSHFAIVLFVVAMPPLVWIGAARGWAWVRHFGLRLLHLATILFVAVTAWLGEYCPLTIWESDLRVIAGEAGYQRSFIEDWLSRLMYYEAPPWVFLAIYSGFAALVVLTWWRWPPRRR